MSSIAPPPEAVQPSDSGIAPAATVGAYVKRWWDGVLSGELG